MPRVYRPGAPEPKRQPPSGRLLDEEDHLDRAGAGEGEGHGGLGGGAGRLRPVHTPLGVAHAVPLAPGEPRADSLVGAHRSGVLHVADAAREDVEAGGIHEGARQAGAVPHEVVRLARGQEDRRGEAHAAGDGRFGLAAPGRSGGRRCRRRSWARRGLRGEDQGELDAPVALRGEVQRLPHLVHEADGLGGGPGVIVPGLAIRGGGRCRCCCWRSWGCRRIRCRCWCPRWWSCRRSGRPRRWLLLVVPPLPLGSTKVPVQAETARRAAEAVQRKKLFGVMSPP